MDVKINKKNGEAFTFEEYGILVKDFIVSSIPLESNYGKVEGRHGTIDYGATYGTRTITVPFLLRAHDLMDFPLLRDVLFNLVLDTESFYIQEMRRINKFSYLFVNPGEPAKVNPDSKNRKVGGKRYLVRLQNTFDIDQIEIDGRGELVFETTELPFAESIGTTQDIHRNGIHADDELWGFGMGLIADDDSLIYTHEGRSFKIYNPGTETVHPFEQDLKITIDRIQGSSSYFELRNDTTQDVFRYNSGLTGELIIDGPSVLRGRSFPFVRSTNMEFITLAPGWNDFRILGASSARVAFDFRFYYK